MDMPIGSTGPLPDVVDLVFRVTGQKVPADHGYALYGAICRVLPQVHGVPWIGIHPLCGVTPVNGVLALPRAGELALRLPAAHIPQVLRLAGHTLTLGRDELLLGVPHVRPLIPCTSLDARLVVIHLTRPPRKENQTLDKSAMEAAFRAELSRQIEQLGVRASISLTGRRQITVGGQRIVGWSVRLAELDESSSLVVQARGLGGKRAMGCGIFVPTRRGG
jgi:CRISPR-associated endonuclease/helicase Cas3